MQASPINKYNIAFGLLVVLALLTVICIFIFKHTINLDQALAFIPTLTTFIDEQPVLAFIFCLLFYISVCSIPFPFVSVITLSIGYFFGFIQGLLIASFGSSIGALILFILARHFLKADIINNVLNRFSSIKSSLQTSNMFAAFCVRFIPGLPFFIPSLVFSLSNISILKFYLATQLGLLITIAIYINAGSTLSSLNTADAKLFSPEIIISMLLIGLLPLALKILNKYQQPTTIN